MHVHYLHGTTKMIIEREKKNNKTCRRQDSSPQIAFFLSEAFKNHMSIHAKHESNPSKALPKLTL